GARRSRAVATADRGPRRGRTAGRHRRGVAERVAAGALAYASAAGDATVAASYRHCRHGRTATLCLGRCGHACSTPGAAVAITIVEQLAAGAAQGLTVQGRIAVTRDERLEAIDQAGTALATAGFRRTA